MRFVSIIGPKDDIDRVTDKYISKYEIHLENTLTELSSLENVHPFLESNPYGHLKKKYKSDDVITYQWVQNRDYNYQGHYNFYYNI